MRRGGKHSERGLEVLMLRRGSEARFMPGVWVFAGGVVEEAAQASINAERIGGPVVIPEAMRAAALQRAMAFEQAGTRHA